MVEMHRQRTLHPAPQQGPQCPIRARCANRRKSSRHGHAFRASSTSLQRSTARERTSASRLPLRALAPRGLNPPGGSARRQLFPNVQRVCTPSLPAPDALQSRERLG